MTADWGMEDPAAIEGPGQKEAFQRALAYLRNRISPFLALPLKSIDAMSLQNTLRDIGKSEAARESI
jgi:arsenate reductase (thioredoxin)